MSADNSQYRLQEQQKWWRKDINPTASFAFLLISMLVVFAMGALFMREYMKIWSEISTKEQEILLLDKKSESFEKSKFEQIILP